jgi:ABC-type enterochelin transport system substrate-binding protein
MFQWLIENWHKIGIIVLFILHFWERFEKIFDTIKNIFSKRTSPKKKDKEIEKLIKELSKSMKKNGFVSKDRVNDLLKLL